MTQQLTPTQSLTDTWTVATATMNGFAPFFQERTVAAMRQAPPHWFIIVLATANDPQPVTLDQVHAIFPYNERRQLAEVIEPLLEGDYLQETPDGSAYRVTEKGRNLIQGFYDAAHDGLDELAPLPQSDLREIRDLLQAIVHNIQSPLPAGESIFHAGRYADPGPGGSLAAQIDQYVTDLYYFRDDAHISAWRATGLDGPGFEALTLLWRDQAHTAAEINERLANRRLSDEAYAAALERLAVRGLVTLEGETAQLTEAGRALREDVEARTDEIFFAPWQVLDGAQQQRLHGLLQQLQDRLQRDARRRMWPLMNDVATAMQPLVQNDVRDVMQARIDPPVLFNHMRMAREAQAQGQPYTLQRFLTRFPYASPHLATERLDLIVEKGYMRKTDGQFELTEEGSAIVDAINDAFYAALGKIEALPDAQMDRLNELLRRLVEAALNSNAPSTDRLRQTYNSAQPREYAPLARVDLNIDDLNAFRDDAHTSAWAGHFASGRDWETLTYVWRDQAHAAPELAQQLAFRGWDEDAYQTSLDSLQQRGWLQEQDGVYSVTPEGDALRRRVEQDTDELFYALWDETLSAQEQNELRTLLVRLKVQLQALQEARETST